MYRIKEEDFDDCYIQLRNIDPRNIEQHGVYNALPGFLYWNKQSQQMERIKIEAGNAGEFIPGSPSQHGDYAAIFLYGGPQSYHLNQGRYRSEFYFSGVKNNGSLYTKLFGATISYDGNVFFVEKIEL